MLSFGGVRDGSPSFHALAQELPEQERLAFGAAALMLGQSVALTPHQLGGAGVVRLLRFQACAHDGSLHVC